MIKYTSSLIFFVILFAGLSLYQIKHFITKKEMELAEIQKNIIYVRSDLKILKAELSYLKRPDRIEKIAIEKIKHFVSKEAFNIDGFGKKIVENLNFLSHITNLKKSIRGYHSCIYLYKLAYS